MADYVFWTLELSLAFTFVSAGIMMLRRR